MIGTIEGDDILEYWKSKARVWPALCSMARDVLAVPATSVGVERLFNTARDACHYRRGNLKPETVRALMMIRHFDKAKLEDEVTGVKEDRDPFDGPTIKSDMRVMWEEDFISSDEEDGVTDESGNEDLDDSDLELPPASSINQARRLASSVTACHTQLAQRSRQEEGSQRATWQMINSQKSGQTAKRPGSLLDRAMSKRPQ